MQLHSKIPKRIIQNAARVLIRFKLLSRSRGARIALLGVLLIIFATISVPITYEKTELVALNYKTQYKDEIGIELGEKEVAQEGKNGLASVRYRYNQSLFDYFFNKNNATKIKISNKISTEPTDKVVLKGTRKWQYMMCSNGSYRYFSNDEFKNPSTGFTSKSPDYCAQNKQGSKISLADSPSGKSNATKPSYVPSNCTIVNIPYKTTYQDVDWLYVGETQEGYGLDGFKYVCSDSSRYSSITPIDKIIYRGTKQKYQTPSYSTTPSTPTQNYAAKQKCDKDYNHAKAQISIAGAGDSSAMIQLQHAYAQCLASAGY